MKKINDPVELFEIGRVRFRGRHLMLGISSLRDRGIRGIAFKPKHQRGTRTGAVIISKHLPVDGPLTQEAIIHETLHVAFPKATERQVREGANLVARVLRKFEAAKRTHKRDCPAKFGRECTCGGEEKAINA